MVYVALVAVTVGVPVMVHVPAVKLRPVGSDGEMAHVAPARAEEGMTPVLRYVFPPWLLLETEEGLVRSDGLLKFPLSPT